MMKKAIILCISLILGAFLITGCSLTEPIFNRKLPRRESHRQGLPLCQSDGLDICQMSFTKL